MEAARLLASDEDERGGSPLVHRSGSPRKVPVNIRLSPIKAQGASPSRTLKAKSSDATETSGSTNGDGDADGLEAGQRKLSLPIVSLGDRRNSEKNKRRSIAASSLSPTRAGESRGSRSSSSTREKITVLAVIVHLLKGNIGPGAMSLPSGFSKTGIYAAPVYFIIVALVSTYNMDLLLYCKRVVSPTRAMSFGDVAGKILGPRGKLLIDVFLVGTQLGICCVYFTFIATNIHVVLPEEMQAVIHPRQLIFAIFPIILMLSWIRTLNRITPYSSLANVAVFLGIAIVFYYSIDYYYHPTKPRTPPVDVDVSQFPEFYGTAVYSFEGIGLILPIQNEMLDPHAFPRVLAGCMLAILVLFLFIGQVPTLAFGRISNGSMTAVLHEYCEGWLVTMANLLLAFACLLSFPIQFYPAVDVLEKAMSKQRRDAARTDSGTDAHRRESIRMVEAASHRRRTSATTAGISRSIASSAAQTASTRRSLANGSIAAVESATSDGAGLPRWLESLVCSMSQYECNRTIFRSMLCTGLMVIAVCVPDVSLLISLFGAVGSSVLAIIVPPAMYLKLHSQQSTSPLSTASRLVHWTIIVFGVLGMLAGTEEAVRDIVASFNTP